MRSTDFAIYNRVQELLAKIREAPLVASKKRLMLQCIRDMEPISSCNKPEMLLGLGWLYLQLMKVSPAFHAPEIIDRLHRGCLLGGLASISRSSREKEK